jgi:hypothetical protein
MPEIKSNTQPINSKMSAIDEVPNFAVCIESAKSVNTSDIR